MKIIYRALVVLVLTLGSIFVSAQTLNSEKQRAKDILKVVAKDIEKNFYDPQLRGVDWNGLVQQTNERIDRAQSVGQIYASIYALVDKLGDSHTQFFAPARTSALPLFGFEAKAFGDDVLVNKLKKGGAADSAGLQLGDRIVKVNQFDVERNTFDKMMLYYKVLQPASQLKMIVKRGDDQKELTLAAKMSSKASIINQTGEIDDNVWDLLHEWGDQEKNYYRTADTEGIAYLNLASFVHSPDWTIGFAEKVGKPKAVIVDLRGNFGGSVDSLAAFVSHFVTQPDEIAEIVTRKKTTPTKAKPHRSSISVPMVVLVDSQSYSASEAFAKYFQLKHKATIIGDHTRGFLTAANFFGEAIGAERIVPFGVQIATGKVVFPGNEVVEGIGITPDRLCLPKPEDLRADRDPCYAMATAELRKMLGLPDKNDSAQKKTELQSIKD